MSVQFANICRTCLSEEQNMKSVFDTDFNSGQTLQLFQMLMDCTSVQVAKDDGLPSHICLSCIKHIARSFTFKKRCEESDATLRKALRKSTISNDFTELKPCSDVALCSQQPSSDINHDMVDIKMKCEEGETHINDCLISSTQFDDIKTMVNVDDLQRTSMQFAYDEGTKASTLLMDNKNSICRMPDETEQAIYPCEECTACFTVEDDLKIHSDTHLKSTKNHKCNVCGKEPTSAKRLAIHMRKVHANDNDDRPHVCSECGERFKRPFALKKHHTTVHPGVRAFGCKLCAKRFNEAYELREHVRTHTNERNYTCATCGLSFVRRSNMISHQRRHTGVKTRTCNICGKQSAALARHMKMHTGVKDHVCPYCDKRFGAPHNLKIHKRTHTGEKPYICKICSKGFVTSSGLAQHMRRHSGAKPHVCDVCDHSYALPAELREHKRMHTGEKPYECHLCPKTFPRKQYLRLHIRTHTGKRPHVCVHCKQGFYAPSKLRNHLRTHTGEKPYPCEICNKSFARADTLSRHLKGH